mmetsp:Transcript_100503/g.162037  ORF Transcript_100503/g.162037 Transcript_100503/m.162037 type:complete len:245 (+) Transcript_100503:3604-4338(+)
MVYLVVEFLLAASLVDKREGEANEQNANCRTSRNRPGFRNQLRHVVEFGLQHSLFVLILRHFLLHQTLVRIGANSKHKHASLPLLHHGASKNRRRYFNCALRSFPKDKMALFLDDGLACERSLGNAHVVLLEDDAVSAHFVARAQQHYVTHHDIIRRNALLVALTDNGYNDVVVDRTQSAKLLFLLVVADRRHGHHYKHGPEDGQTFEPLHTLIKYDANDKRHTRRKAQENQTRVLQRLPRQFQ